MTSTLVRPLLAAALLLPASALHAQATTAAPSAAAPTVLRRDVMAQIEDAEKKFLALAEATPQEKYAYRPAPGVRSTGEVFMHMVGANYALPGMIGAAVPADVKLSRDMEKTVTDKAQIVDMLRKSFAHAKSAVAAVPDAELNTSVSFFGRPSTKSAVMVTIATHAHEHLGQSIAYARVNGIVPPWSQGAGGN